MTEKGGANDSDGNINDKNFLNQQVLSTSDGTSEQGVCICRSTRTFGMNAFRNGWFSEIGTQNQDPVQSLQVAEVLYQGRSEYQDILVFRSKLFGRVLVLDNAVQCAETDEFAYQEMMSFLPLNCHPSPKKVLIIGGGDGGVAREVVKHPAVENVTQCEIDEKVIEVCKKYLPFMAKGFDSPKVKLHIGDGFAFVKKLNEEFDVIITDSSDPVGPATCLFQKPYYEALKGALKPGGFLCSQGECFWFDLELIKGVMNMCRTLFPVVKYASVYTPTYPGGQIGFVLCSKSPDTHFKEPVHVFTKEEMAKMMLRYYTPDIHRAAFTLPAFLQQELS